MEAALQNMQIDEQAAKSNKPTFILSIILPYQRTYAYNDIKYIVSIIFPQPILEKCFSTFLNGNKIAMTGHELTRQDFLINRLQILSLLQFKFK